MARRIREVQRIIAYIRIAIQRLRIAKRAKQSIGTCKAASHIRVVTRVHVVKPGFVVSLLTCEMLPHIIIRTVSLQRRPQTLTCNQLFTKRQIIMTTYIRERATLIEDHSWGAELIAYQPVNVCR